MLATALRIRLSRLACRCLKECLIFKFGQGPEVRSQSTKPTPVLQLENIPSFGCAAISAAPQAAPTPGSRSKWFQASLFLPRDSAFRLRMEWQKDSQRSITSGLSRKSSSPSSFLRIGARISEQHCSVSTSSKRPPHSSVRDRKSAPDLGCTLIARANTRPRPSPASFSSHPELRLYCSRSSRLCCPVRTRPL